MKKNVFYFLVGLSVLLTACQSEKNIDDYEGTEAEIVNFKVSVPEAMESRGSFGVKSSSASGGITNVDFANYDLRYQLAVYKKNADNTYTEVVDPQKRVVDVYQSVDFSLRLIPNRTYKVVVWADFVEQGEEGDLHYDTGDFENITCKDAVDKQLNDESRDAYCVSKEITVGNNGVAQDLILKRPFSKLRVVCSDWNLYNGAGRELPDNFKVTYYNCNRFVSFNAVTGVSEKNALPMGESTVYTGAISRDTKEYSLNYDMTDNNRTLIVDYLMTDKEDQTPIHFKLDILDGTTILNSHDFSTNIPIQRNWLTTIIGNLLTVTGKFSVSCEENFENQWVVGQEWWDPAVITPTEPAYDATSSTYTIKTRDEFAWLPDNAATLAGKTISIESDIDMSGVDWKPIYTAGEPEYTVEGNGHTLKNFSMNGQFGAVYEYKKGPVTIGKYNAYTGVWGKFEGSMRNLTFENITINGRADDEVNYDTQGDPVDHSKEEAYFAGCIGYTGANYSTKANFSNVHARNVVVKSSEKTTQTQNIGGLIGWLGTGGGNTWLENCSAEDIHLTGYQAGGLIGQILGGREIKLTNCKTEEIYIRIRRPLITLSKNEMSGFIGYITDGYGPLMFINCTSAANVVYIKDADGTISDYTPSHEFYGNCADNEDKIEIIE